MKFFSLSGRGVVWFLIWAAFPAWAEVKLPALFADHMVLQGDMPVPVWGWAKPGESVTVEAAGQKRVAVTDAQGKWRVELAPLQRGTHLTLAVRGANQILVHDVLVGEVWLGSGQSNMGLTVNRANNFPAEQAAANFPELRMFTVAHNTSPAALDDCKGSWQICNSNTVGEFSATLYFFGREIHQQLKVPVGLIHSSWGGTPIQPWMSPESLKAYPGYATLLERKKQELAAWPERQKQIAANLSAWQKADLAAKAAHQPEPVKPWNPGPPDSGQYMPSQLYNAMIHPLIPYRIRGALWYQGEANAGGGPAGAQDYTDLQNRLIAGWRQDWGGTEFPFYFVQLPNWNNDGDHTSNSWAFFREGQANSLQVPATGMAVTIDIGEADNIHPKNKQAAGHRLALIALAKVYHQPVIFQGPQFARCETNGVTIRIYFKQAAGGLLVHDGAVKGFLIAGVDKKWHLACAQIDGDAVMVSSPEVLHPVAVRYGWANNPDGNLYNGAGLPVMPFRTDRWP